VAEATPGGILDLYLKHGGRLDEDSLSIIVEERPMCSPPVTGSGYAFFTVPPTHRVMDETAVLLRAIFATEPDDAERIAVLSLMAEDKIRALTDRAQRLRVDEAAALAKEEPEPGRWTRYTARATAALAHSIEQRAYAIYVAAARRAGEPEPDY
jgi:hypothetical protein